MVVITNCHEVRLVMRLQLEKFIITRAVGFDLVAALLLRALYLFCQNERLLGVFFCSHLQEYGVSQGDSSILIYKPINLCHLVLKSIPLFFSSSLFFSFHIQKCVLMTEGHENNKGKVKLHPTLYSLGEPEVCGYILWGRKLSI